MQRFFDFTRILTTGAPAPNATITVYDTTTLNLSTIYSDDALTPKANPFTADVNGYYFFYADNGDYDVKWSGITGQSDYTLGGIGLNDNFTLNNQRGSTQTMVVGTAGPDFGIQSALDIHTFNLPDAGVAARGVVTTGAQTFAGLKAFTTPIAFGSGGTGLSAVPAAGQLLIGNGTNYSLSNIQGTGNQIIVTNGPGPSIILSTPQDIASGSAVTFSGLRLTGLVGATARTVLVDNSGFILASNALLNGQVLIGVTGGNPTAGSITAGSNITVVNAPGAITISAPDSIQSINGLTGANQTLLFINSGAVADLTVTSAGTSHSLDVPNAGSATRGVVSTGTQTFAGSKIFQNQINMGFGTGGATINLGGPIHVNATPVATSGIGTAEEPLMTYTLPAGTENTDLKYLRITSMGTTSGTAATHTIKFYIGAAQITIIASANFVGKDWWIQILVIRTAAGAQRVLSFSMPDGGPAADQNVQSTTMAADLTIANIIKLTGQTTVAASIITQHAWIIEAFG